MVKVIQGDLLDAAEDYICHQVNTMGVIGEGIAKDISDKWPIVKEKYITSCHLAQLRNASLLGTIYVIRVTENQRVVNIFGQTTYRRDPNYRIVYTDYDTMEQAFRTIRENLSGSSLAFPYGFGCEVAQGDWSTVLALIELYFGDMDVTIYQKATER